MALRFDIEEPRKNGFVYSSKEEMQFEEQLLLRKVELISSRL